jgi:hypothetical protein
MPKLTFHQGVSRGDQVVTLDGDDISSAVRSLSLKAFAGEAPELVIQPAVYEFSIEPIEVDLDVAMTKVHVAEETVDLLKRFGWTPPLNPGFPTEQASGQEI